MSRSDLLTAANGITFARLVLFAVFLLLLSQNRFAVAIGFFVAAWALDAADGYVARWLGQESKFGSQLDKIVDRVILILGVLALIKTAYLPAAAIFLLTKDIGLAPVLTIHAMRQEGLAGAGRLGKLMAAIQGGGIFWLLLGWPYSQLVIGFVAVLGGLVAWQHLRFVAWPR
jgi:phosphatidylglycerophosphate synthase